MHFITPEYPYSPDEIRMHSAGKDELRVILEPDDRTLADLRLLIKTEKYTRRKQTTSLSAIEDQILRSKAAQNVEREKELVDRIRRAVGKADLVINAADITSTSQEALTRVTDGFQDLINRTYTQLSLLGGTMYNEQHVARYANPDQAGLIDDPTLSKLAAPGDEVLSFVLQRDRLGEQITVKSIVDTFQAKPYGWDLASIEVVTAWLVGTSKITLIVDGNVLKRSEVAAALRNTQKHSHTVVTPQKTFDDRKVAAFRKFCIDFFDEPTAPKDPLELARHGSEKLRSKLDELKARVTGSKYPFVTQLAEPITLLEQAVGKPDEWYLTDFSIGGELLDAKENVIDPIQEFLNGGQRTIYDTAAALLTTHTNNLRYLPDGSETNVRRLLDDANAFRGNRMTQLSQATQTLQSQIDGVLTTSRAAVTDAIENRKSELLGSACYANATEDAQQQVLRAIDQIIARLGDETQIALIREQATSFEEATYPSLLDHLAKFPRDDNPLPPKKTVSIKTITVPGMHGLLETPDQVDQYLGALRAALLDTLTDGKQISL